ncbi:MAG: protoporphyrinogen oxidase [Thermodesulfobacteriota bacterium]
MNHDVVIVGGGLSGLAVAHFLRKAKPDLDLLILEQAERPGGAVRSCHDQGYLAEWGPHGFLDNNPASRELLADLGLDRLAQRAPLGNFVRFLCHRKRLIALPQQPQKLLATPLVSLPGKFRALGDLFKKPLAGEPTIAAWVAYRFGSGLLPLADAAVTGTFAGDYERLAIDAVMPGVRRLEKEHGSVLRGLIHTMREKKKNGPAARRALPAMTSFPGGMEQLTTTLAAGLPIRFGCAASDLARTDPGWQVRCANETLTCRSLIVALPVNAALKLLAPFAPPVPAIPEARIATVALGFAAATAEIPYGFGYLAPEREQRFALGALFSTHMFPGRAPQGQVLLEALVGGRRHPERLALDDSELVARTYADLKELVRLPAPPVYSRVLRSPGGIPQLEVGHRRLQEWRETLQHAQAGLHLCGFGWEGIGMNDMMGVAKATAMEVAAGEEQRREAAVRPVYF